MLLDHVNLRCREPERMVDFIHKLGCASKGDRPAFDSHGFWLYDDSDRAVIHVSTATSTSRVSEAMHDAATQAGVVDHVAFRVAESEESLKARLIARQIEFTRRVNALAGVIQILVQAPEGLVIELQVPIEP